ncbi:efflux RND transporter permease subunit, partial [Paraglaciecola sp.]|uniref:efflux RND transporter permease subunit n=1 Tax=Paraglaciecola sp. TaxID=1920173 RepID=UPI003EF9034E
DQFKKTLPSSLTLKIHNVSKDIYDARFNLLKDNAISGLVLVFTILMLFLRPKLAIWVVVGIVTAFAGAIWALPYFGISFNMLSMFAFLMVLGIVVDDAIIVGESVYSQQRRGIKGHESANIGVKNVFSPVVLAVLSTIIFFVPMVNVPTQVQPFTVPIFFVVTFCLLFSLAESLLILPAHLAHMKPEKKSRFVVFQKLEAVRHKFSDAMESFASGTYKKVLNKLLTRKGSTVLGFTLLFGASVTMFAAGWLTMSFFPNVPAPFIQLNASFADGSPYRYSTDLAEYMKKQASALETVPELMAKNGNKPFIHEMNTLTNGNQISMFIGLTPSEERDVTGEEITKKLQELIGPLPELQSYSLQSSFGNTAPDIQLNLSLNSNSVKEQQAAVEDVKSILAAYEGIENVRSNLDTGRLEVEVTVKDYAQTLGITARDISTQVRQAFFGEEVQRIPRSKEDVKVMLRFPLHQRKTLDTLDDMRIRTAQGDEIPLEAVAVVNLVPGTSTIRRTDRIRNITITAEAAEGVDSGKIVEQMLASYLDKWKQDYIGFDISSDGNLRAQAQFGDSFAKDFLFAFVIAFSLFAISFKSIFEPLLVLVAVPFGFMGAVFGHLIGGYDMSLFSFMGFLACSGVVVNDNLVLLERINQLRKQGLSAFEAALAGGVDRFRPIVLTSLTTFIGLLPIMFERSTQALFLIPMVISLAFGVLFSSVITLLMIPCAYLGGCSIGDRAKQLSQRFKHKFFNNKHENKVLDN